MGTEKLRPRRTGAGHSLSRDMLIRIDERTETMSSDIASIKKRLSWVERIIYGSLGLATTAGAGVSIAKAFIQ